MGEHIKLGDVIRIKHGYAFPGSEFSEDPSLPTLVTPGNFALGGGFRKTKPKTFSGHIPKEYILTPGSLVITMTDLSKEGATLGLPARIPEGETYLHNQRIGLVKVIDKKAVDASFLNYYLRTRGYREYILGTASGSTVRHTSPSKIEGFTVSLPNVTEQRAIAETLGALDNKIAADDSIASKCIKLAELHYKRSIVGKARRPMSSVLEPVLGGTPSRADGSLWGGSVAWASAKDITGAPHGIVISTSETISEKATERKRTSPLPSGTVVLTARGTVGAVARLGVPSAINQSCYGFTPETIPTTCLFFTVKDAANQARTMAHGSVFDTITMNTFDHVQVPNLGTQEWQLIEMKISPLVNLAQQRLVESAALRKTRDSLLPLLMSGKIRVRDAEKAVEETV